MSPSVWDIRLVPKADIQSRAGQRGSVVVLLDTVRFEFGHEFSIYLLHR